MSRLHGTAGWRAWPVVVIGLAVVATAGVVRAQVKTGSTVKAYSEHRVQDGRVSATEEDQYLADDVTLVGEPPYQLIQLRKEFTPPEGYTFRKFRESEKVRVQIDKALEKRTDPGDGKEWRYLDEHAGIRGYLV